MNRARVLRGMRRVAGEAGRAARRLTGIDARERRRLRTEAEQALAVADRRLALRLLLELDDRFEPDAWVLTTLADIFRQFGLAELGLECVERCVALGSGSEAPDLTKLRSDLEAELERHHRLLARLAHVRRQRDRAVEHGLIAAQVATPSAWTMRVLVDGAIAAGTPEVARPHLDRVRRAQPEDPVLAELVEKLDG